MSTSHFYHALKINRNTCIGCTHCVRVCPTHALRVKDGKAYLLGNRCVDCGECVRACPVDAISVEQDDFNKIFEFKNRIALVPAVLYGQFPGVYSQQTIISGLKKIGFTHVYEAERSIPALVKRYNEMVENREQTMPLISTFCPAIVRLVQVRFPSLVKNLMRLKPPIDLTAMLLREQFSAQGEAGEETGIFYVTPCAAKIAAVKSPVGTDEKVVDGVINMTTIYNLVYPQLETGSKGKDESPEYRDINPGETNWSLTRGEARLVHGRCLAVDGIQNVIDILDKLESGEGTALDFLELRACDEGCAGGVLNVQNRFLTVDKLIYWAKNFREGTPDTGLSAGDRMFLEKKSYLGEILSRSMLKLDEDTRAAIEKMDRIQKIVRILPGVDCGICGSPDCSSFAEDLVQHRARLSQCLFLWEEEEPGDDLPQGLNSLKEVWTKNKFSKKSDTDHDR